MKNLNLFLSAILIGFYSFSAQADEDLVRFVEHDVARSVIQEYFGNINKNVPSDFVIKYDDETVLNMVTSEYNKMLSENGGFVSADGIVDLCVDIFNEVLEPKNSDTESDYIAETCYDFIDDLVKTESVQSESMEHCKYKISMVPNKFHIKYEDKNTKHGFIRHCDNYIGWRTFNPGNLADSPYKCAKIGGQAVFESEEMGFRALEYLLTENSMYKDYTLRQKISLYARSSSAQYLAFLKNYGVDIDKKLSTFKDDPEELQNLLNAMATKEGWFNGVKKCQGSENASNVSDKKGVEYF